MNVSFFPSRYRVYNQPHPLVSVIVAAAQRPVGDNTKGQSAVYPKGLHLKPLEESQGAVCGSVGRGTTERYLQQQL